MLRRVVILLALSGLVFTALPPASGAGESAQRGAGLRASDELRLYGPSAEPRGHTWALWSARYFEWIQEVPTPSNPAIDPDSPRNCERHYNVVMMAPYGTGKGCEVPAKTPVLLTFNAWSCSTAEGNGRAWHKLRRCARESFKEELSDIRVRLFLDGDRVRKPGRWTFDSARRVARLPKKNIWDAPPGRTRFLGRGMFFMVRPLNPGAHVIRARLKEAGKVTVIRYTFTVV